MPTDIFDVPFEKKQEFDEFLHDINEARVLNDKLPVNVPYKKGMSANDAFASIKKFDQALNQKKPKKKGFFSRLLNL
ncbi:hypothetical protein IS519_21500 [Vibrio crassostreae]|uniref:hypothetical protein n=1 Tax=Vibrio crassostreae TaxID=246167 RepID=UPI00200B95AD|nr:hypothetical protein [Vibrio crassostreae]UPR31436.1 hypothetical protein IS519_21500 [Vibrio crassostreae]